MSKTKRIISMIMLVALLVAGVWFVGQRNNTVLAEGVTVDKDMLSVKCQTKYDEANNTYDLRVVTTLNTTSETTAEENPYSKVGFEITVLNQNGTDIAMQQDIDVKEGYERIITSTEANIEYNFSPMVFHEQSKNFATCTLTNIPESYKDNGILIKPYVVLKNANSATEKTYGTSKYLMIQDGLENTEMLTLPLSVEEVATLSNGNLTVKCGEISYSGAEFYKVNDNVTDSNVTDSYTYVRIPVDTTELSSVTDWTISDGTQSVTKEFRNLYSKLLGSGSTVTGDQTWYDSSKTTHMIVTAADLYGLAELVNASSSTSFSGHTVYIANDIVVNTQSMEEMKSGTYTYLWNPIGLQKQFNGTFDGNGHSISGLYMDGTRDIDSTSTGKQGLFYQAVNCTIKNLKLVNSYMACTGGYCGSIAGYFSGTIENVYSDAYVVNTNNSGENVGGLVGCVPLALGDGIFLNCQYAGIMNTTDNIVGGIVGQFGAGSAAHKMLMENCLVTGTLNVTDGTGNRFGGLVGSVWANSGGSSSLEMKNCVFNGTQTGIQDTSCTTQNHGLLVGQIATGSNKLSIEQCYAYSASDATTCKQFLGQSSNAVVSVDNTSYNSKTNASTLTSTFVKTNYRAMCNDGLKLSNSVWCDTNYGVRLIEFVDDNERFDISWYNANASEYTLNDGWQLIGMSYLSNQSGIQFAGKSITLSEDITLNTGDVPGRALKGDDTLIVWTPIGLWKDFKGIFNGNNHSISGLYINDKEKDNCGTDYKGHRGLFYKATDSTIQNLRLLNSYIESNGTTECGTGGNGYAESGSIAGVFSGTLQNVYSNAYIKHSSLENVGGLIGKVDLSTTTSNISNCQFAGTIVSTGNVVGGIVGQCTGATGVINMTDCLVTGTLNMQDGFGNRYGGVVGSFNATNASTASVMTNCIFNGIQTGVTGTNNDDIKVGYGLIIGQLALGDVNRILRLENCYAFKANTVCSDYLGNMQTGIVKYGDKDTEQYTTWGQSNNFNKAPYTKTTGDDFTVTGCNLDNTIWVDSSTGPILKIFK